MNLDRDICYIAVASRDPRFDGRFFTGVRSTGIYCRPICPAQIPKRENCRFFPCAAAAEEAGFRPCLRCRPEASPETPAWQGTSATVSRALKLIAEGALDQENLEDLALRLGVGARHLRRLFKDHLGASPNAVAISRRVRLAKRLLDETGLSITEVALSSGFGSIRRFNAAIRRTYGMAPTKLRRKAASGSIENGKGYLVLRLPFRPPYSWEGIIEFLQPRAIPGVEVVDSESYQRTIELDGAVGLIEVKPAEKGSFLLLRLPIAVCRKLKNAVERVRRLFDLDADPVAITEHLARDPLLSKKLKAFPGLRVPGAWDRFELAVRAILGQQITVQGATKFAGRLVRAFGEPVEGLGRMGWLFPKPEVLAAADLASIGLVKARAKAIRELAAAVRDNKISLHSSWSLEDGIAGLIRLPGIGPWTAHYIAMRGMNEPDAFPAGDLGLRQALAKGGKKASADELAARAEAWRPWRAYAAMYLWKRKTKR